MKRRDFIKTSALAGSSLLIPELFARTGKHALLNQSKEKILVIVQWSGGNDGLNTIVPFRNDIYYKLRPKISIKREELILLHQDVGMHPKLAPLQELLENGEMAIIQNVGYPEPDRSHFRSMDIWQSASKSNEYLDTGWIGRMLDFGGTSSDAIEIDDTLSLAMKGEIKKGLALRNLQQASALSKIGMHHCEDAGTHVHDQVSYLRMTLQEATQGIQYLSQVSKKHHTTYLYPNSPFAKELKSVANLIHSGAKTTVYYLTLSGFDTHAFQPLTQNNLFNIYAQAILAFRNDLKSVNRWKDVAVFTFSEFGRRVRENAGKGTDHGTAGVSFVMGGSLLKGGLYGGMPDLTNLIDDDLRHTIDFRQIYSSLLEEWLQVESSPILRQNFEKLKLF